MGVSDKETGIPKPYRRENVSRSLPLVQEVYAVPVNDITRVMVPSFPATPEKNCRECYQYDAGRCCYCDLPVIDGMRCGFFIRGKDEANTGKDKKTLG